MSYQKVKTEHFYRLQKLMGLGHQLIPIKALAELILTEKGSDPASATRKNARNICVDRMREVGIVSSTHREELKDGGYFVYVVQQDCAGGAIKIGMSDDVESRIKTLQTAAPYKLKLIVKIIAKDKAHALYMEKSFHEKLNLYKLRGEWFSHLALKEIKSL